MTRGKLSGTVGIRLGSLCQDKRNVSVCEGDEVMKELEAFFNTNWLVSNYRTRKPQWKGVMKDVLWTRYYLIVYYDGHDYFFGDEGCWEDIHRSLFPYTVEMSGKMKEILQDTMRVLSL